MARRIWHSPAELFDSRQQQLHSDKVRMQKHLCTYVYVHIKGPHTVKVIPESSAMMYLTTKVFIAGSLNNYRI